MPTTRYAIARPCAGTNPKIVGWVEQRETHRHIWERGNLDGFCNSSTHPTELSRAERVGVVERPVAASQARRAGDRALDVGARAVDRLFDVQAFGQARRNRRG